MTYIRNEEAHELPPFLTTERFRRQYHIHSDCLVEIGDSNLSFQYAFDLVLQSKAYELALVPCFRDGTPTAALCCVNEPDRGLGDSFHIQPLFVAIDESMMLTDHFRLPHGNQTT